MRVTVSPVVKNEYPGEKLIADSVIQKDTMISEVNQTGNG